MNGEQKNATIHIDLPSGLRLTPDQARMIRNRLDDMGHFVEMVLRDSPNAEAIYIED